MMKYKPHVQSSSSPLVINDTQFKTTAFLSIGGSKS
jgi:hypothetical protein